MSDHPELRDLMVIGHDCMSYGELEGLVETLKRDLDLVLNLRVQVQSKRWDAFWSWYLHHTTPIQIERRAA